MGLDTVELAIKVEKAFDIAILDEEGERIVSAGDLYQCVLRKLAVKSKESTRCRSAVVFYRLRTMMADRFGIDKRGIRPASLIDDLVSFKNRNAEWQDLGNRLGWEFPALCRPPWVSNVFFGLLAAWLAVVVALWKTLGAFSLAATGLVIISFLAGMVVLGFLVDELTRPWAICFPVRTMREMITVVLARNFAAIGHDRSEFNGSDVWDAIRGLIAEAAGISIDQINESTHFVRDLGMD
jgi:acyl carrier protein